MSAGETVSNIWPDFVTRNDDGTLVINLGEFSVFSVIHRLLPLPINTNVIQDKLQMIMPAVEERIASQPVMPYAVYTPSLLLLLTGRPAVPNALTEGGKAWPRTLSVITLLRFYMGISYAFIETSIDLKNKQRILDTHSEYAKRVFDQYYMQMDNNPEMCRLQDVRKGLNNTPPSDWKLYAEEFAKMNRLAVLEYLRGFEIQIMEFLSIPRQHLPLFLTSDQEPQIKDLPADLRAQCRQQEVLFLRYRDKLDEGIMQLDGIEEWSPQWKGYLSHEALYNMTIFFLRQEKEEQELIEKRKRENDALQIAETVVSSDEMKE